METWLQMTKRHKAERDALVMSLASDRITQTQAARMLGISLTGLNNYIHRRGIFWPVVQQGKRQPRE
jgi:transcriptional regulator with GAF, ATPase, and Fis domain